MPIVTCLANSTKKPLPYPHSEDIEISRKYKRRHPQATPMEIASQTFIGPNYKELILWMRDDLKNYLANFDAIFEAKLRRIEHHQLEREADLKVHTAHIRGLLMQAPGDTALKAELDRLIEIHKPQGVVETYNDSKEFLERFVGPMGKLLKSAPSEHEQAQMDKRGLKKLYVDTWAVPFFNTGTQTRDQAKEGVRLALEHFDSIDLKKDISILEFTNLMALFTRPEFDDVRRYKLKPFPNSNDLARFGLERSDAKTFGAKYPEENLVTTNKPVDLGPVSYIFGQRLSIFGLISHSLTQNIADGRIFTGPADFLEHDFAHAFFNLTPAIPGSAEEWETVHRKYMTLRDSETNPKIRKMIRLVYYHFTHESGFRVLLPHADGSIHFEDFDNEFHRIIELIHTRHHYDFILSRGDFDDGYEPYLKIAFEVAGNFFKKHFIEIQNAHQNRQLTCQNILNHIEIDPKN